MTNIEKDFLELHKSGKSTTEICSILNINRNKGYKILQKNKLKSNITPRKLSEDIIEEFCLQYKQGKTIKELSVLFDLKSSTINYWLRKKKLTRPNGVKPSFNENYFENINSKNKAYFLGLLYADGGIVKSKSSWGIFLELKAEDKYIIEAFSKEIDSKINVKEYTKENSFNGYSKPKHNAYLHLGSKKMAEDLEKLGCCRNKTFELKSIPNIDNDYIVNFLMGFFDGDGIASYGKVSKYIGFCGTKDMMSSISYTINKFQPNISIKKPNYNKSNHIYYLTYGRKDATMLYEWFYSNNELYLKRKKEKFEKIKL